MGYQQLSKIAGGGVFLIAAIVYALTAEPTGSLWDCGEFIAGAYKLEVVHPPGAPVFILIGRFFTLIAETVSNNPEHIAYAVNLMSGLCTAVAAMMICWVTMIFGKIALVGRGGETNPAQNIALAGAGLAAGLSSAFCVSVWFSAVEGEVYAMSLMFTAIVIWGMSKWYSLPDEREHDRWIVFSLFMAGLSIGVHLLSLLTLPAMALLYYFKKYKNHKIQYAILALIGGVVVMTFMQKFIVEGIPTVWTWFELFMVNSLGMPKHSGLIPLVVVLLASVVLGFRYAKKLRIPELQYGVFAFAAILIAYSSYGLVVIRAGADTPINMNAPSDAMRLLPYLNREQYGERPLLYGPNFTVAGPSAYEREDRYNYSEKQQRYVLNDEKLSYKYSDNSKKIFPRLGHMDRGDLYREWLNLYKTDSSGKKIIDPKTKKPIPIPPTAADNFSFFVKYQLGWMYFRYFMWNFSGKQNKQQGYFSWDKSKGHWISGINALDKGKVGDVAYMTSEMKQDQARNVYYMIPFLLGLIGIFFFFKHRPKEGAALAVLFFMTGIAIIIYTNQPPNEPRERDYVLVGSFVTYCIFIGMAVLQLFKWLHKEQDQAGKSTTMALLASAIVLVAPILMGVQNYDDNDRSQNYGARDYATNFLNSVEKDAIIFTYGDNDTYPLWYAQEVEDIRTDVRVVNLSLIQVDWYIDQLRRKVNNSDAISFTVPAEKIRGKKRTQFRYNPNPAMKGRRDLKEVVKFLGDENPLTQPIGGGKTIKMDSYLPSKNLYIEFDSAQVAQSNWVADELKNKIQNRINFDIPQNFLAKGDLALLDIIASNIDKRPIYFAVTVQPKNILGLRDYLQMEGLGLRIVPVRTTPQRRYSGLSTLGYGAVAGEKIYDNVKNKWKWGGFDECTKFVDDKYGPSIQSMYYVIERAVQNLIETGQKDKAKELAEIYFERFPACNFSNDVMRAGLLSPYAQAGGTEEAKTIATSILDRAEEGLMHIAAQNDPRDAYQQETYTTRRIIYSLVNYARVSGDKDIIKNMKERLSPYLGVLFSQGEIKQLGL